MSTIMVFPISGGEVEKRSGDSINLHTFMLGVDGVVKVPSIVLRRAPEEYTIDGLRLSSKRGSVEIEFDNPVTVVEGEYPTFDTGELVMEPTDFLELMLVKESST